MKGQLKVPEYPHLHPLAKGPTSAGFLVHPFFAEFNKASPSLGQGHGEGTPTDPVGEQFPSESQFLLRSMAA
jgi:hypothetical protein